MHWNFLFHCWLPMVFIHYFALLLLVPENVFVVDQAKTKKKFRNENSWFSSLFVFVVNKTKKKTKKMKKKKQKKTRIRIINSKLSRWCSLLIIFTFSFFAYHLCVYALLVSRQSNKRTETRVFGDANRQKS